MKKYVVWGLGNHAKFLFDNFYGLEKFVEVFLDNNYDGKNIGGGANTGSSSIKVGKL